MRSKLAVRGIRVTFLHRTYCYSSGREAGNVSFLGRKKGAEKNAFACILYFLHLELEGWVAREITQVA